MEMANVIGMRQSCWLRFAFQRSAQGSVRIADAVAQISTPWAGWSGEKAFHTEIAGIEAARK
jgi:hypothetical protein